MIFKEKSIVLKDGRTCILRSPKLEDAFEMMEFIKLISGETNFILRYPEECNETVEQEEQFLLNVIQSNSVLMIIAFVDGKVAGNCQLNLKNRMKVCHRASIGIGIKKEYWNVGIGSALFKELIQFSEKLGLEQLELEFIEGNKRAQALYEKMGFVIYGERKNAIKLKDGTYLSEFLMVKSLDNDFNGKN
jgi:RimJ/RimL family protein N-acetyltransferase